MGRLIAIFDNGKGKRGQTCDECGAALRFEYHLSDGGRFGSCCVKGHLDHVPDWLTLKAARDFEKFRQVQAGFERQYDFVITSGMGILRLDAYDDGGVVIWAVTRYGEPGGDLVIERLLAEGWKRERDAQRRSAFPNCVPYILRRQS